MRSVRKPLLALPPVDRLTNQLLSVAAGYVAAARYLTAGASSSTELRRALREVDEAIAQATRLLESPASSLSATKNPA
jgi:hypothetical protein